MRLLLFVLLLPSVYAVVGIYAKGFDTSCYSFSEGFTVLAVYSPETIVEAAGAFGEKAELFYNSDDIYNYSGAVILSCTDMNSRDVNTFLDYAESGGRLVVDVRDETPLSNVLGVFKSDNVAGKTVSAEFLYASVDNGILIDGVLKDREGPTATGYERIVYVGKGIYLPEGFISLFVSENGVNVAGRKDNIVVTGCFYCSDHLLMANLFDWLEDGRVDLSDFSVKRIVTPRRVEYGDVVEDRVEVIIKDPVDGIEGEYIVPDNTTGYCNVSIKSFEVSDPEPFLDGYRIVLRSLLEVKDEGTCYLPPMYVYIYKGGKRKEVYVPYKEVLVTTTGVAEITVSNNPLVWAVIVLFIVLSPFLYRRSKVFMLKRRLKELVKEEGRIMRMRMKRLISEEGMREKLREIRQKREEVKEALRNYGVDADKLERQLLQELKIPGMVLRGKV